ncbi:14374_t:CDS:2, partial [Acaulospora colombiana]
MRISCFGALEGCIAAATRMLPEEWWNGGINLSAFDVGANMAFGRALLRLIIDQLFNSTTPTYVHDARSSPRKYVETYHRRTPTYGRICGLDEATVNLFVNVTLDFENDSLEELKTLRMSANPQWSQPGVDERQTACETMNAYLEELSDIKSPDHNEEGQTGESMIGQYNDLIAACKKHDECREESSSTRAVKDMQEWHERGPNRNNSKFFRNLNDVELRQFNEIIEKASSDSRNWLVPSIHGTSPNFRYSQLDLLDRHQSRTEEIKTLMARL